MVFAADDDTRQRAGVDHTGPESDECDAGCRHLSRVVRASCNAQPHKVATHVGHERRDDVHEDERVDEPSRRSQRCGKGETPRWMMLRLGVNWAGAELGPSLG